jgi:hypothetical protein
MTYFEFNAAKHNIVEFDVIDCDPSQLEKSSIEVHEMTGVEFVEAEILKALQHG